MWCDLVPQAITLGIYNVLACFLRGSITIQAPKKAVENPYGQSYLP